MVEVHIKFKVELCYNACMGRPWAHGLIGFYSSYGILNSYTHVAELSWMNREWWVSFMEFMWRLPYNNGVANYWNFDLGKMLRLPNLSLLGFK